MAKPMNDDQIQSLVKNAVDEARAWVDAEIQPDRVVAQNYFDGNVDFAAESGRSKIVATKCQDTIRALKPSIMRTFLQTKAVEFLPRGDDDVMNAEHATEYVHMKLEQNNFYQIFGDMFHDAAVKKTGVSKAYYEETERTEIHDYSNLSAEEFTFIVMQDNVEVVEHTENEDGTHDVKLSYTDMDGDIRVESVPPEEFFVDSEARSLEDFYVCGQASEKRAGDLVEMGFKLDDIAYLGTDGDDEEEQQRQGYASGGDNESGADVSMRKVLVTEAYMRMDIEGTGKPVLYSFLCGGPSYKILRKEPVGDVPFAVFEIDPEPHAFFGRSLVELIKSDQDVATSLLRSVIDNVAMTNVPRVAFDDATVNVDDVLNNEIGAVIRTKGAPHDKLMPFQIPFTAGTTLPALQYFDMQVENKTGVSRASTGMDPDALQSTTAAGVNATIQAAAGQAEVIARNLAEGGMKRLCKIILGLAVNHASDTDVMRVNGSTIQVQPGTWDVTMDMSVNVGLGTGQQEQKAQTLMQALQWQQMLWQMGGGPQNGLVSLTQMRNTIADLLKLGGIPNGDRYFMPMTPEREQMLMQQAAQAQQGQQQGNNPIVDAEMVRAQAKLMEAQTNSESKAQLEREKMRIDAMAKAEEADRKRDQMDQDLLIEAAKLSGQPVPVGAIQDLQQRPRT
jgi:hypothetical protein